MVGGAVISKRCVCGGVVRSGRCTRCRPARLTQPVRASTPPPPSRRPSAAKRGYGSRWRRYRAGYLARNPLCVHCDRRGVVSPATQVDHIRRTWPQDPNFYNALNHQALCARCHTRKTTAEGRNRYDCTLDVMAAYSRATGAADVL